MCQDELDKLNGIVWPAIRQLAEKEIRNAADEGNFFSLLTAMCEISLIIFMLYSLKHRCCF